jgi:lipid A 3-O-deacylase
MRAFRTAAFAAGLALALPAGIFAQDLSLTIGTGDDDTTLYRLGVGDDFAHWATDGAWQWTGAWRAEIGYWESDDARGNEGDDLWEVGFTPLVRLEPTAPGGFAPYLEAGIGGRVLSDTRIGRRQLATAWQFGSHIGAGVGGGGRARV